MKLGLSMKDERTRLERELLDEMTARGYGKELSADVASGLDTPELQTALLDWIRGGQPTGAEVVAQADYLLVCRKFGEKGTRYFLENGEAIHNIVVKDGVIGRLWFDHEKLSLDFGSLERDDWFRVLFFNKGQSDDGSVKWSEVDEREFYVQWFVEQCLWCTAPHVQELRGRRGAFLETVDGVVQMRRGIADELRKTLEEVKSLRREHEAMAEICQAERSRCNRSILRELDEEIEFLESDIEEDRHVK